MRVHNVYSDLLLGLSRFINNKVLHGRPIEHWQLNIGDSGLQLDYEQGYSLPAGIINLESIQPFNNHPYVFQHRSGNIHSINALYNEDKDLLLKVQEEQFNLNVSMVINCQNHMQALDVQHQLLSYLPVGKYMHFYEYICFLEIDDFLVNKWLFDINNDTINNLFIKQNRYTDSIDYSFGLKIQPLLRFNDITIQMSPDTNQETFQVSTGIEYLMTIPVYLHYPHFNIHAELGPDKININRDNVLVPVGDRDYCRINVSSVEPNDRFFKIIDIPLYRDDNINDFTFSSDIPFTGKDNEQVNGKMTGSFSGEVTKFDFESMIDNKVLIGSGEIFHDYEKNEITGELKGYIINGKISEVRLTDNGWFTCWFEGTIDNRPMGQELVLQTREKDKFRKLKNIKTVFKNSPYILIDNKRLWSRNIYDAVGNVTEKKTNIIPSKTSIEGLVLRRRTLPHNKLKFMFPEGPLTIRTDGALNYIFTIPGIDDSNQYQEAYLNQFLFNVPYGVVLYDFLPEGNYELHFSMDMKSGAIELAKLEDRDNRDIELDYEIDQIIFDNINFELVDVPYGNRIERINVDMSWVEGSIITDSFPEEQNMYSKYSKIIVLSELLEVARLSENNNNLHHWTFSVNIKNIPNLPSDLIDLAWKMVYPDKYLTTTNERDEVELLISQSIADEKLVFKVTNLWYYEYFKNINRSSPLFLSIGQKLIKQ
jgi:hypothetical protein